MPEKPKLPKPAHEMTTEEAMRFLFAEPVVEKAKEIASNERRRPTKEDGKWR